MDVLIKAPYTEHARALPLLVDLTGSPARSFGSLASVRGLARLSPT
jgi:hypothetical protein